MSIVDRYRVVGERIAAAARRAGRDPEDVLLVAVSKDFPASAVVEAMEAGMRDFGENRAQELRQKAPIVGAGVTWHFVGHLQTNKVRLVVGLAEVVHSVDRFGLAEAIARRARGDDMQQDVLLEVNVSGERTKHGLDAAQAHAAALEISGLEGIAVKGLMTMPPLAPNPEDARPFFREIASLRDRIASDLPDAVHLSMGMSRDYEVAIEEGATMVRVGEAIFGPRRR